MEPSSAPWRVVDAPVTPSDPVRPPAASAGLPPLPTVVTAVVAIAVLAIAAVMIGAGAVPGMNGSTAGGGVVIDAVSIDESAEPAAQVVVDVAGAVAKPGVYRLPQGSRVGDAVRAAGGYGPRVDAARAASALNLAAILQDGAQIVVPSRDDQAPAGVADGGLGGDAPGGEGLVDLNEATQAELDALPGIGPVTAKKIIAARSAEPFVSVDDLRARKLVGQKTFDALRDLVTAP